MKRFFNPIGKTFEVKMHYCRKPVILGMFLIIILGVSCYNNATLETFDLGDGRAIKVTTGWADNYLPVYFEMYTEGQLINKSYLFSETPDYQEIKKLRFKILRDKSNQVFILMQNSPNTGDLAVFDFSTKFTYPGCTNNHSAECVNERNRLVELLERDNPGLSVKKLKIP